MFITIDYFCTLIPITSLSTKNVNALAALASTAAFAQSVTLSGGVAYGYQSATTDNVTSKGFGMDTAAIKLTATEDLGGGMSFTGVISAGGFARNSAVKGEDMSVALSGGFGKLMMGQIEIGSGIRGIADAGAPVNNMEGEVLMANLGGAVVSDIVSYTAPKMGDFTLSGSLTEDTAKYTGNVPAIASGMSTGQAKAYTVGVSYAAGPVAAKLDTSSWKNHAANDTRYRVAASYNFGVAKVGAGRDSTKQLNGTRSNETMLGVSAPFGALTVGAAYVKRDTSAAGTLAGNTVGVSYALSKRTSVLANYAKWDHAEGSTVSDKKTTILLNHAF